MVGEETLISEKIIKLFTHENIDIWFKNYNIIIEFDEGNHANYDSDNEKEREDMFKNHNLKMFWCNPNDFNFNISKFSGEINLYVSKLQEKNAVNGVISKITDDFKKIVAKLKKLKRYAKNILPNYKKWKIQNQKENLWKLENNLEQ